MKTTWLWHKWQSAAILKRYLLHVTVAQREREGEIWTVDDCLISSSHVVVAVHSQGVFIFNHPHRGRKRQLDPEKKPKERTNWKIAGWDRGWKNIHEKMSLWPSLMDRWRTEHMIESPKRRESGSYIKERRFIKDDGGGRSLCLKCCGRNRTSIRKGRPKEAYYNASCPAATSSGRSDYKSSKGGSQVKSYKGLNSYVEQGQDCCPAARVHCETKSWQWVILTYQCGEVTCSYHNVILNPPRQLNVFLITVGSSSLWKHAQLFLHGAISCGERP